MCWVHTLTHRCWKYGLSVGLDSASAPRYKAGRAGGRAGGLAGARRLMMLETDHALIESTVLVFRVGLKLKTKRAFNAGGQPDVNLMSV